MNNTQQQLADTVVSYSLDPEGFVLFAFPWGKEGTDLAHAKGPRAWQSDVLRFIGDKLTEGYERDAVLMPILQAVASGHGIGKSALVAMLTAWALCTCPDTKVVITANTEPQLRTKTFPEISKWFRLLICAHWFKVHGMSIHSTLPGHVRTWRADAVTWSETNLEAFAGLHNIGRRILLIFDEASGIIDHVWEVAEGALTDEGTEIIWCAFGNPTQPSGRFFECFNRQRNRWNSKQVDSRTIEGTNNALFDQWAAVYGDDSDFMRVRVKGQFPRSGSMQFINSEIITKAVNRQASYIRTDAMIMGVDVARYGDDQSVIFFRKGRDGKTIPPILLRKVDTMQLAARVADEAKKYGADAVFIDGGGVGGGVVDRCRQLRVQGLQEIQFGGKADRAHYDVNAERYGNKRAEMWGTMRTWLETGCLPNIQDLQTDLSGPWYFFNAKNEIILERKEDMKKRGLSSPDVADALALTFAYPVMNSFYSGSLEGRPQQTQRYDPWGT